MTRTMTRRPCRWAGPTPAPADFDGWLYTVEAGGVRWTSYGLAWVEGRAVKAEPGVEIVREWEGEE